MRTIGKKVGFKVNPKDLRSSNEALLASLSGWNIHAVSRQLGHSTVIAERSYTKSINMVSIPTGDTIEQVSGLTRIGFKMMKAVGMNTELTTDLAIENTSLDKLTKARINERIGDLDVANSKSIIELERLREVTEHQDRDEDFANKELELTKVVLTEAVALALNASGDKVDPATIEKMKSRFLHFMKLDAQDDK